MVDLVTFALDVEDQGTGLALDVALQVVVVLELELGRELNLDGKLGVSRDDTLHRNDLK